MRATSHRPQRNWGARLREYDVAGGLRAVFRENELLRVGVLADRGTDVFELLDKPRDLDFAWPAGGGVRDARTFTLGSSEPFLDAYPGGSQEVLPHGGAPSSYAGTRDRQHDEIGLVPWDYDVVDDGEEAVAVRFAVTGRKSPLRLVKELRLAASEPRLRISATLNESDLSVRLMWGAGASVVDG